MSASPGPVQVPLNPRTRHATAALPVVLQQVFIPYRRKSSWKVNMNESVCNCHQVLVLIDKRGYALGQTEQSIHLT